MIQPTALPSGAVLRVVAESDIDELAALVAANHAHLAPWMPWAEHTDGGETRTFVLAAEQQAARGDGFHVVIERDGRIVGTAGFHHIDRVHRATSLGYWLARQEQGRGTMTQAVAALLDHAFGPWNLHRVELRAATGNAASRAVAARLGFVEEGVLRDAERFEQRYEDLVVCSILADEWRGRAARPRLDRPRAAGVG